MALYLTEAQIVENELFDYYDVPSATWRSYLYSPAGRHAFAMLPTPPRDAISLGDSPHERLSPGIITSIEEELQLGESLIARTAAEVLLELRLHHADPTGQQRWKPIRGSRRGGIKLKIGRSIVATAPFSEQNAIAIFRADYRRRRAAGEDINALRRFTGYYLAKLRKQDAGELLPAEYSDDGSTRPETVYTDEFTRSDQTGLGGNWTHLSNTNFDIVSNWAQYASATGEDLARYDQDLSSDDHSSQVDVLAISRNAGNLAGGLIIRKSSAASVNDYYLGDYFLFIGNARLFQQVAGVFTLLDSSVQSRPLVSMKLEADDSDNVTLYFDGAQVAQETNETTITGNVRAGMRGDSTDTSNTITFDNWRGADGTSLLFPARGSRMMQGMGR